MRDKRLTAHQRGYTARWQKESKAYLKEHPLCVACSTSKRIVLARVVDHIKPHKGDMVLFWSIDNWQSLCRFHHNLKTAKEDGGFGNKSSTKPLKECGPDGHPLDKNHHWNK